MTRIIALFNLRPGVDPKIYEDWARKTDLATVRNLKSVDAFNVYRSAAVLGKAALLPYPPGNTIALPDRPAAHPTLP